MISSGYMLIIAVVLSLLGLIFLAVGYWMGQDVGKQIGLTLSDLSRHLAEHVKHLESVKGGVTPTQTSRAAQSSSTLQFKDEVVAVTLGPSPFSVVPAERGEPKPPPAVQKLPAAVVVSPFEGRGRPIFRWPGTGIEPSSAEQLVIAAAALPAEKRPAAMEWAGQQERIGFEHFDPAAVGSHSGGFQFLPTQAPVLVAVWTSSGTENERVVIALAPTVGKQLVGDISLLFARLVEVASDRADATWIATRVIAPALLDVPLVEWTRVLEAMRGRDVPESLRRLYIHADEATRKCCEVGADEAR